MTGSPAAPESSYMVESKIFGPRSRHPRLGRLFEVASRGILLTLAAAPHRASGP
jgi:hypothetical protein